MMDQRIREFVGVRHSAVYHVGDGFYYVKHIQTKKRMLLRCIARDVCDCRASMPLAMADRMVHRLIVRGYHTHPPDFTVVLVAELRNSILRRCREDTTTDFKTIFVEECSRVDSEVASQLDLGSMTSSMRRARKMGTDKEVEFQEGSGLLNIESDSSASTSNAPSAAPEQEMQDGTSEIPGTSQWSSSAHAEEGTSQSSSSALAEEGSAQNSDVVGDEKQEDQARTVTLADVMKTTETAGSSDFQTPVIQSAALKTKRKSRKEAESTPKGAESTSKDDIKSSSPDVSEKMLESAIQRLESVSNKLISLSLVDSYDQFGKYISTVLRGLPVKKVHFLKQKILSEVMRALDQEESGSTKNVSESLQEKASSEIRSNFNKITTEKSQAANPEPKGHQNTISNQGSYILVAPGTYAPSPLVMMSQVTPFAAACGGGAAVLNPTSALLNTTPLPQTGGGSYVSTTIPIMSSSPIVSDPPPVPQPSHSGKKRRRTPPPHATNNTSRGMSTLNLTTSGDDSSTDEPPFPGKHKRMKTKADLPSEEDFRDGGVGQAKDVNEFEMDITEGNELQQMKQDQEFFETVLCGESSNMFIKEEVPDPDESESSTCNTLTTYATCHLCNTKCTSREELIIHFSLTHPGYDASGCKEIGSDFGT